ncbi:hypothetical protein M408DRAFT_25212 [Serendipita vermifera MAFF 305830]|uniref:Uncharacterized protein n=1 Tax=Serendipita vermifera MAFF 305830 TaxID=933852 RepID=A0A0C2XC67_SERVB|nr:hypothetical protein M408DRAFT_25212 [Serendipita vermifera MAFF 305830]
MTTRDLGVDDDALGSLKALKYGVLFGDPGHSLGPRGAERVLLDSVYELISYPGPSLVLLLWKPPVYPHRLLGTCTMIYVLCSSPEESTS